MNWYILYCQTAKVEQLCGTFNGRDDIEAFVPMMETYRRDQEHLVLERMFPGYLFVKTHRSQNEFSQLLLELKDQKDGVIRELRKEGVSSLTDDEITLLNNLLDEDHILRMSYGIRMNGKSIPYKGPLIRYTGNIERVDFYRHTAYLNIHFLGRKIICGLTVKRQAEYDAVTFG